MPFAACPGCTTPNLYDALLQGLSSRLVESSKLGHIIRQIGQHVLSNVVIARCLVRVSFLYPFQRQFHSLLVIDGAKQKLQVCNPVSIGLEHCYSRVVEPEPGKASGIKPTLREHMVNIFPTGFWSWRCQIMTDSRRFRSVSTPPPLHHRRHKPLARERAQYRLSSIGALRCRPVPDISSTFRPSDFTPIPFSVDRAIRSDAGSIRAGINALPPHGRKRACPWAQHTG